MERARAREDKAAPQVKGGPVSEPASGPASELPGPSGGDVLLRGRGYICHFVPVSCCPSHLLLPLSIPAAAVHVEYMTLPC